MLAREFINKKRLLNLEYIIDNCVYNMKMFNKTLIFLHSIFTSCLVTQAVLRQIWINVHIASYLLIIYLIFMQHYVIVN